jgi:regulator of sigma E protease
LGILVVFGVVIFVHEFGHFIVAKKTGVKVDRFSFGLGPEIVGFQWGETRYCLAWFPLGGEVRMAGEMDAVEEESQPPQARDPRSFFAQPWYRRIPIVVAGPLMNYALAFLVFSLVAFVWGDPKLTSEPVIGEASEGFPAHAAGIRPGDRILSVEGQNVSTWPELAEKIHQYPEKPVRLEVERGGETLSFALTPRRDPQTEKGKIGIAPRIEYDKVGFFSALHRGFQQTAGITVHTLSYLYDKFIKWEKPELSGPVGIASVVAKATRAGPQDFLFLIGLISVGIGLFNLFPIPLLDGGHLMFYLWEGLTRKPATRKAMQIANAVGLSFLLGVLFFATYSDIQRMRVPDRGEQIQK